MRQLVESRLVLASHNAGKLREIQALLLPYSKECVSAAEFGLKEPEETESTFVGNAKIKAIFAAEATGLPALSDDSGISVDALDGAPGVYTADWAETDNGRDFELAMTKVWDLLETVDASFPRRAQFNCTLCLAWPDGHCEVFEGVAPGQVVWPLRGENGFGFDPMFLPDGQAQTFGEMSAEKKQPLTHRADAFRKLVKGILGG